MIRHTRRSGIRAVLAMTGLVGGLLLGTISAPRIPTAAAAAVTIGAAPASGHGPLVCPANTVNFETRGWWTPAGVSIDLYEGVDAEICAPLYSISGQVPLLVHVQLRRNFGTISFIRIGAAWDPGNVEEFHLNTALKGDANGDGEWYVPAVIDTTKAPDGWLEYRVTANVDPDGFGVRQFQSMGVQILTLNGHPRVADYRARPDWIGRGWYLGGYENVSAHFDPPTHPVSGLWSFRWDADRGASGFAVTYHAAYVDANTHAIPMLLPHTYSEGSGPFSGITAINTTLLPNGIHKLLLRADARVATGTISGLSQILFDVENGPVATPTPTIAPTPTPTIRPTPVPTPIPTPAPSSCAA